MWQQLFVPIFRGQEPKGTLCGNGQPTAVSGPIKGWKLRRQYKITRGNGCGLVLLQIMQKEGAGHRVMSDQFRDHQPAAIRRGVKGRVSSRRNLTRLSAWRSSPLHLLGVADFCHLFNVGGQLGCEDKVVAGIIVQTRGMDQEQQGVGGTEGNIFDK